MLYVVVCYQSDIRNSNNISGYVYNREFITQPIPINHSPPQIQILNLTVGFFSQTHVFGCIIKGSLVSIICVTLFENIS